MSRTLARMIAGVSSLITLGQSPSRRMATYARVTEALGAGAAYTIETRRGVIRTLPMRGPHLAAAALGFHDEEPETLEWIDALPAGSVLYDIGAATGLFALYAALNSAISVVAFEPKATSFGVLVEQMALNGMGERIIPLPLALSDQTAALTLNMTALAPQTGGNSVGAGETQFGEAITGFSHRALAYRLDDLIEAFALPAPTHIKIDVDGIEGLILRGAPKALAEATSVVLEVEGKNADHAAEIIDPPLHAAGLVEDLGFRDRGSRRNRLFVRA